MACHILGKVYERHNLEPNSQINRYMLNNAKYLENGLLRAAKSHAWQPIAYLGVLASCILSALFTKMFSETKGFTFDLFEGFLVEIVLVFLVAFCIPLMMLRIPTPRVRLFENALQDLQIQHELFASSPRNCIMHDSLSRELPGDR